MPSHLPVYPPAGESGSRRTLLGMAAAVWLTCGLVQCVQTYVLARAMGRPWDLANSLITGMPWWASWFALTPLIALVAERFPFSAANRWRSLGAHVVVGAAISSVQLVVTGSVHWLTTGRYALAATSLGNQVQRFFGSFFLESMVTYGAAAGVLVAIDFARARRDEAVQRARAEAQMAELEASVTRARLDALAMELNPHFLFNTLSAVSGLVGQDRRVEAREVIGRLGELLRRTLDNGNGHGPLSSVTRELELLEDYLYIQRIRFSDRLRVTLVVDDSARDVLIPAMLLQPLVENAIRHGVEPNEGCGNVNIRVERISAYLRIVIADSGGGFVLDAAGRPGREGIGIGNTRARLAHLYGENATLVLRNRSGGGAETIVQLPAALATADRPTLRA